MRDIHVCFTKYHCHTIHKRAVVIFGIIIVLLVLSLLSVFSGDNVRSLLETVARFMEGHPILGSLVFVILAALSAILSPFSSIPLAPAATVVWGKFLVGIMLGIGWTLGGILTYSIGWYAMHPFAKRLLKNEKVQYYKGKIPPKADFWLVLLFRLALPSEIPGYVLGSIRYPFGKYLLATAITEVPFAFVVSYASDAFIAGNMILFISLIIISSLFVFVMFYFFHKRIEKKK